MITPDLAELRRLAERGVRERAWAIGANPATVLALLDRLEAAEKIVELARRVVHHEDQSAECAQWRDWDGAEMHDDATALAMDKLRAALDADSTEMTGGE